VTMTIGGLVSDHALAKAVYNSPMTGATCAQIIRYAMAKAAGFSAMEAQNIALGTSRTELSELPEAARVTVEVPDTVMAKLESQFPGKPRAWLMRFSLAKTAGMSDKLAANVASEFGQGRPVKREAA
jgi:hypothetical protein